MSGKGRGRPVKELDLAEVEKLGMLGATAAEMAAWFSCGLRTIERRMGTADGDFRRAYEKGFGRLKISTRRLSNPESCEFAHSRTTVPWTAVEDLDCAVKKLDDCECAKFKKRDAAGKIHFE